MADIKPESPPGSYSLKIFLRKKYQNNQDLKQQFLNDGLRQLMAHKAYKPTGENIMTRQISLAILIFACCSIEAEAAEDNLVTRDQNGVSSLCIAAAEDDLERLKRAIRHLRSAPHQKYKTIINSVRCNGQVAAQFALNHKATGTFDYLYKFTEGRYRKMLSLGAFEGVAASTSETGGPGIDHVHVTGR